MQLIKGGFSFRVKKELGFCGEVWQKSYYDRRVRDFNEYAAFREYMRANPVKQGLGTNYPYGSAHGGFNLDGIPQRLKPVSLSA